MPAPHVSPADWRQSADLLGLTAKILSWLGEGRTNAEIGRLLGVSPRTVEKHCGHLFAQLGVESRLGAALLLSQNCAS